MTALPRESFSQPNVTIRPSRPGVYGPALEITSPLMPDSLRVELKDESVIRGRSARLGASISKAIEELRSRPNTTPRGTSRLLNAIAGAADIFLGFVLREQKQVVDIADFFRRACPSVGNPQAPAPVVHIVVGSEDYFPWELMPLFGYDMIDAEDKLGVDMACRTFLGFSCIVERRHSDWSEAKNYLSGWSAVPVRMIYNAKFEGARAELGFFQAQDNVVLEGPYPRCVRDRAAPSLARQLVDPRIGIDGLAREWKDEIVHISCHCDAKSGSDSDEFSFYFADDHHDGEEVSVSLSNLLGEMVRFWRGQGGAEAAKSEMPFVFLNACGTSALDPGSAASFLQPFYGNRNRGIVATAANVTDRMAADVSKWFYTELFSGCSIGEALHLAKWRLLQDRGNPLGLLYSVHALADLRILPVPQ